MARYLSTYETKIDDKRAYKNVKYPLIPPSDQDVYVTTTFTDRFDILAKQYYQDKSLWWVISTANPNLTQNSLYPPAESIIRIPGRSRIPFILSEYESLNS